MAIGRIVGLPPDGSRFARVRDEYDNSYTVDAKEIPKDAKEGDDFAYKVDVFHNEGGMATTLKKDD